MPPYTIICKSCNTKVARTPVNKCVKCGNPFWGHTKEELLEPNKVTPNKVTPNKVALNKVAPNNLGVPNHQIVCKKCHHVVAKTPNEICINCKAFYWGYDKVPSSYLKITKPLVVTILVLVFSFIQAFQVFILSKEKQEYKSDNAEVTSIKYGLMSVHEWKKEISIIFKKKIAEFELTDGNRGEIGDKIEEMLYWTLNQVDAIMTQRASEGNLFQRVGTWFVQNFALDLNDLRERVPEFTRQMLRELGNEETMTDIKSFINSKFDEYLENTIQEENRSKLDFLLAKYSADDINTAARLISIKEKKAEQSIWNYSLTIIVCSFIAFLLWFLSKDKYENILHYYLLIAVCAILLFVGVTTPMIDIDARIQELSLQIAGEPVAFKDQVLFFQSKSILDVVKIMMTNGQITTLMVGVLIFIFSIIFPLGKLFSSILVVRDPNILKRNQFVRFLAMKSGKWAMADVTVVAIFMSYIGFQGVINNQLAQMEMLTDSIEVITTNNTSLQVGFVVFTFFCIGSLFLSTIIETYSSKFI